MTREQHGLNRHDVIRGRNVSRGVFLMRWRGWMRWGFSSREWSKKFEYVHILKPTPVIGETV
jgi:hypothetical protein